MKLIFPIFVAFALSSFLVITSARGGADTCPIDVNNSYVAYSSEQNKLQRLRQMATTYASFGLLGDPPAHLRGIQLRDFWWVPSLLNPREFYDGSGPSLFGAMHVGYGLLVGFEIFLRTDKSSSNRSLTRARYEYLKGFFPGLKRSDPRQLPRQEEFGNSFETVILTLTSPRPDEPYYAETVRSLVNTLVNDPLKIWDFSTQVEPIQYEVPNDLRALGSLGNNLDFFGNFGAIRDHSNGIFLLGGNTENSDVSGPNRPSLIEVNVRKKDFKFFPDGTSRNQIAQNLRRLVNALQFENRFNEHIFYLPSIKYLPLMGGIVITNIPADPLGIAFLRLLVKQQERNANVGLVRGFSSIKIQELQTWLAHELSAAQLPISITEIFSSIPE